jgi:hypothetical protein
VFKVEDSRNWTVSSRRRCHFKHFLKHFWWHLTHYITCSCLEEPYQIWSHLKHTLKLFRSSRWSYLR